MKNSDPATNGGVNGKEPTFHKRPVWTMHLNAVHCSVWKHDHDGAFRYTIAIFREYYSKKENKEKRDYYFDLRDLEDIRSVTQEAERRVLAFKEADNAGDPGAE